MGADRWRRCSGRSAWARSRCPSTPRRRRSACARSCATAPRRRSSQAGRSTASRSRRPPWAPARSRSSSTRRAPPVRPKGVSHTHGAAANGGPSFLSDLAGVGPGDRCLAAARSSTALGLFIGLVRPLAAGAAAVLSARPATARRALSRRRGAQGHRARRGADGLAAARRHPGAPPGRGRTALLGAAGGSPRATACRRGSPARLAALGGPPLVDGLGSSECGDIVLATAPGRAGFRRVPAGVEVRVADRAGGPMPGGRAGPALGADPVGDAGLLGARRPHRASCASAAGCGPRTSSRAATGRCTTWAAPTSSSRWTAGSSARSRSSGPSPSTRGWSRPRSSAPPWTGGSCGRPRSSWRPPGRGPGRRSRGSSPPRRAPARPGARAGQGGRDRPPSAARVGEARPRRGCARLRRLADKLRGCRHLRRPRRGRNLTKMSQSPREEHPGRWPLTV